jgi:hypothetical protein
VGWGQLVLGWAHLVLGLAQRVLGWAHLVLGWAHLVLGWAQRVLGWAHLVQGWGLTVMVGVWESAYNNIHKLVPALHPRPPQCAAAAPHQLRKTHNLSSGSSGGLSWNALHYTGASAKQVD